MKPVTVFYMSIASFGHLLLYSVYYRVKGGSLTSANKLKHSLLSMSIEEPKPCEELVLTMYHMDEFILTK